MFKAFSFILFAVAYMLLPCSANEEVFKRLSRASIDLGLASLRDVDNWKSAVISSHSIYDGMYMLQEMAKGQTLQQLTSKVFDTYDVDVVRSNQNKLRQRFSQLSNIKLNYEDIVTLKRGNDLYIAVKGVNDRTLVQYTKIGKNSARLLRELNRNVSRLSNGIINDAFALEPQQAPLMLTNVLYFKGEWKYKFDKSLTKHNQPFYAESDKCKPNGQDVTVSLMSISVPVPQRDFGQIKATGIRLPFAGDDVSLYLFLPYPSVSVDQMMKALNGTALMGFIEQLETIEETFEEENVIVEIPIFDAKTSVSLKRTLERLGVEDMFDSNMADFKKFKNTSMANLYVSDVKHKAFFKINEEGAEAAALTTDKIVHTISSDASFRANKPFVYVLANTRTAEVYFLGRYMGPEC